MPSNRCNTRQPSSQSSRIVRAFRKEISTRHVDLRFIRPLFLLGIEDQRLDRRKYQSCINS